MFKLTLGGVSGNVFVMTECWNIPLQKEALRSGEYVVVGKFGRWLLEWEDPEMCGGQLDEIWIAKKDRSLPLWERLMCRLSIGYETEMDALALEHSNIYALVRHIMYESDSYAVRSAAMFKLTEVPFSPEFPEPKGELSDWDWNCINHYPSTNRKLTMDDLTENLGHFEKFMNVVMNAIDEDPDHIRHLSEPSTEVVDRYYERITTFDAAKVCYDNTEDNKVKIFLKMKFPKLGN